MSRRERLVWLCVGVIVGSLLSSPVSAQAAVRMFATLTGDLATGKPTVLLCTPNATGNGCYLNVQVH